MTTMYLHNAAIATNAKINILSGKSLIIDSAASLVIDQNAIFTYKGSAITLTAAELNILDGSCWNDQTYSSITVDPNDRVVYNDAGTMKQIKMSDIRAYCTTATSIGTTTGSLSMGTAAEQIDLGKSDGTTRVLIGTTNVTEAAQRAEIIPCNYSTFGSTLAPIVMNSAQIDKHYDGWYFKNLPITHVGSTSVGTGAWTTRPLDSLWTIADLQYVQMGFMPLTAGKSPGIIVTVNDGGITKKYKYTTATPTIAGKKYELLVRLTGAVSPLKIPGHTQVIVSAPAETDLTNSGNFVTGTTTPTSAATITQIDIYMKGSSANDTEIIIHECNWVTSYQGTISFKFTNDSVVQAQSAQAVAALYAALFKKTISQTTENILEVIPNVADYTSGISENVYGVKNVLANYVSQ